MMSIKEQFDAKKCVENNKGEVIRVEDKVLYVESELDEEYKMEMYDKTGDTN